MPLWWKSTLLLTPVSKFWVLKVACDGVRPFSWRRISVCSLRDLESESLADVESRSDERCDELRSVRVFDAPDAAHL